MSTRQVKTRARSGRVSAARPVAVGPVPGPRPPAVSATLPTGGPRPPGRRSLRSDDATYSVEAAETAAIPDSIDVISLIGTAVRGYTCDTGAVTYGEVKEYHSRSNRFRVQYCREEIGRAHV